MKKNGLSFLVFIFPAMVLSCRKSENSSIAIIPPSDTTTQSIDTTKLPPADTLPPGATSFTYLALGDSYTIGQSVDSFQRFPAQTAALLTQQHIAVSQIQYIATTGWTTINLRDAINMQQPQGPYDIVSLLIGVNDQHQTEDTTNYRSHFTDLLNTAISLAGNRAEHVFVLSIPDYGVTPYGAGRPGVSEQIDQFNSINKEVTENYHISYTDVTTISRNDAGDATMLASDGLHPSGKQYAQWTQALEPSIYTILK